jgi:phospholipid/cholesterol/gamma-HCH transport system permease protein
MAKGRGAGEAAGLPGELPPGRVEGLVIRVGRAGEEVFRHAGELALLLWRTVGHVVRGRISWREVVDQMHWMGIRSLPIVIITALLSGVVTSQQGGYQFTSTIPLYVLGSVVTTSVVLELGPVLTAIVLIGRVGARITAEFGTMKVSEQIDALHSLGRDPVRVLAAPRIVAGVLVVPVLVAIADAVGIFAGMIAAKATSGLGPEAFFYGARLYWHNWNLVYSLMKAVTFGLAIPLIAAHMGFRIRGGAEGVGRGTTTSVMFMTLAILILDALFPPLFLN